MGYEENFLRYLQGLINDVEKRIRRGHQRLALNSMQGSVSIPVTCYITPDKRAIQLNFFLQ